MFRDLINSNICITKIYLTKSNFPSKWNLKSDENKKQIFALFLRRKCQIPLHFNCEYFQETFKTRVVQWFWNTLPKFEISAATETHFRSSTKDLNLGNSVNFHVFHKNFYISEPDKYFQIFAYRFCVQISLILSCVILLHNTLFSFIFV